MTINNKNLAVRATVKDNIFQGKKMMKTFDAELKELDGWSESKRKTNKINQPNNSISSSHIGPQVGPSESRSLAGAGIPKEREPSKLPT